MNEQRFNEQQVLFLLRQVEAGASVMETCRKYGIGKVEQHSAPSKPATMVHDRLFLRLHRPLGTINASSQQPSPDMAADIGFPRFVRSDRASARFPGVPHFLVLDNSSESGSVMFNGLRYSLGSNLRRETLCGIAFSRRQSDYIMGYTALSAIPARRVTRRHYSDDFRMMAVTLASSIGHRKAARQLGIPIKTLRNWLDASTYRSPAKL